MNRYCGKCRYFHVEEFITAEYDTKGGPHRVLNRECRCYALPPELVADQNYDGCARSKRPQVDEDDPACRYFEDREAEERMYKE